MILCDLTGKSLIVAGVCRFRSPAADLRGPKPSLIDRFEILNSDCIV